MPSIFSKIIAKEIPAHILYEDEQTLAFLDIHPVRPGHTLVIPKEDKPNVLENSSETISQVWRTIHKIVPAVIKATGSTGCVISTNIGESAGQSVFHTHFHIIPRQSSEELSHWPQLSPSSDELSQTAEQIRAAL